MLFYYRSQLFEWNSGRFRLDHTFDTQQATDIVFLSSGPYLLLTEATGLSILARAENGQFSTNLTLPLQGPTRVERAGGDGGSAFVVTNRRGPAQMFIFRENNVLPLEVTVSIVYIMVMNSLLTYYFIYHHLLDGDSTCYSTCIPFHFSNWKRFSSNSSCHVQLRRILYPF